MFNSKNEISSFDFSQSALVGMMIKQDRIVFEIEDVIIRANNSQNNQYRDMATNELVLELTEISEIKIIRDGYIVRDMDDKIREQVDDVIINEDEYSDLIEKIKGCPIVEIACEDGKYHVFVDTEEYTESYSIFITAKNDIEEWERFRNLPDEYRQQF